MYPSGTRLLTKDGRVFGNAIILKAQQDMLGHVAYHVETDFGNRMFVMAEKLEENWWISDETPEEVSLTRWLEAREELRLRSSMVEPPTVHRQDTGSVPVATATFQWPACPDCGSRSLRCGCD